jgi:hypothetical protein
MPIHQFRKLVREKFPHITLSIRTVSFQDLARSDAKCLTVTGDKSVAELRQVNDWARQAGVLPDGNLRCYKSA